VSQISPPIRIVLVAAIAFLGAYMLFLRPKDEVIPPAEPAPNVQTGAPAVSQPGKVAEAAQGAVAAADGQLKQQESVDGVDAGEAAAGSKTTTTKTSPSTTPPTPEAPSLDLAGLPKPIAKAIRHNKILVLLFWNRKSADDKAVHAALAHVDRWDGRVSVQSAPIKKISKYGRIARGVDVEQSPTVVVVDPQLRADTLVGYVDSDTIDQSVMDALRSSGGLFKDAYLRKVDHVCAKGSNSIGPIGAQSESSLDEVSTHFAKLEQRWPRFANSFKAIPAPKRWRAFKRATVADNATMQTLLGNVVAYLGPHPTAARLQSAIDKFDSRFDSLNKRYNRRMDAQHLYLCGSQG
jgi:hypothetical protein